VLLLVIARVAPSFLPYVYAHGLAFAVLFIRKNCKRMSSSSHKRNESTEDDADNIDIVVRSDGPSRHEQKRQRLANVKRKTFLLSVKHFTDKILREPDIWMRDDLGFLRKFVDSIKNDPVHFPPSVCPGGTYFGSMGTMPFKKLCSGCVQSLYFFAA
jgi:hypothetical protein